MFDKGTIKKKDKGRDHDRKHDNKRGKDVEKQYRKMERHSRFWNKVDPTKRFRHWYLGFTSVTRSLFRVAAAWQTIVILTSGLVILYILSAFYTGKGEFVIKLERPMADDGFILSEDKKFKDWLVSLRDDAVENATNISIYDIAEDVMKVDGKHNGASYVAYTFYLKNKTAKTQDYHYELTVQSATSNADRATWVMLFHNGKQEVYAQKNKKGYPEVIYSNWEFPFIKYAADAKYQQSVVTDESKAHVTKEQKEYHQFTSVEGLYQFQTIPWKSKDLVCSGSRQKMKVGEADKYTVVVWLEGDDPDCKDDILGGHVEMSMKFMY